MFHEKIDMDGAVPAFDSVAASETDGSATAARQPLDAGARFYAALIVLGLPFVLLYLLARFAWNDTKAVGRGIAVFYRAVTEELSRS